MGFEEFIAYCIWGYLIFDQILLSLTKSMGEREGEIIYQVVKSLRNWAMAKARKAERRGRLVLMEEDERRDGVE